MSTAYLSARTAPRARTTPGPCDQPSLLSRRVTRQPAQLSCEPQQPLECHVHESPWQLAELTCPSRQPRALRPTLTHHKQAARPLKRKVGVVLWEAGPQVAPCLCTRCRRICRGELLQLAQLLPQVLPVQQQLQVGHGQAQAVPRLHARDHEGLDVHRVKHAQALAQHVCTTSKEELARRLMWPKARQDSVRTPERVAPHFVDCKVAQTLLAWCSRTSKLPQGEPWAAQVQGRQGQSCPGAARL